MVYLYTNGFSPYGERTMSPIKRNEGAEEAAFIRDAMDQSIQPLFGLGFFGSQKLGPQPGHLWTSMAGEESHGSILGNNYSKLGLTPRKGPDTCLEIGTGILTPIRQTHCV